MSFEDIRTEALKLTPEFRASLVRELLASLDVVSEAEAERLWVDEAIRRDEEIEGGTARMYPIDEVLARLRDRRK